MVRKHLWAHVDFAQVGPRMDDRARDDHDHPEGHGVNEGIPKSLRSFLGVVGEQDCVDPKKSGREPSCELIIGLFERPECTHSKSKGKYAYAMSHLKGVVFPDASTRPCEEDYRNEDRKNDVSDYKSGQ